jgi:5-methylcytosine-specific restriction endonuclease McrA
MGEEMQSGVEHTKKKETKVRGKRSFRMLLALLESQGYLCALTGVRLEVETAELDHKIPVSRGGTNDLSNLQWIHKSINRAKGTMTNEEFIEACLRVASRYQGCAPIGQGTSKR